MYLQKVHNGDFSTYSWPLQIIFIGQYFGFYYGEKSPIWTILELLQVLAIFALHSKTVKNLCIPTFFFISPLGYPSFSPALSWYITSPLLFIFGYLIFHFNKKGGMIPLWIIIFSDALETKATNSCERCGQGKSTVNGIGKKHKI